MKHERAMFWDGKPFGTEHISLLIYTTEPPEDGQDSVSIVGAASDGDISVVLFREQFGLFLEQHSGVTLICYDAAQLHWKLEDYFRGSDKTDASKLLWAYSRESRLIDIMLLDQHVRRSHGRGGAVGSPFQRLVKRYTGSKLPDGDELKQRIVADFQNLYQSPDNPILVSLHEQAVGTYRTWQALQVETEKIEEAVEEANRFFDIVESLPGAADVPTVKVPNLVPSHHYGPLGVGIDVQSAIAWGQPDRPPLQLDPDQLDQLRDANDCLLQTASARLYDDSGARKCFRWPEGDKGGKLVECNDGGQPKHKPAVLKKWLKQVGAKLSDVHNLPVTIPVTPEGDPVFDSEQWGIWAACHRSLRAWRDMQRATRLNHQLSKASTLRPRYEIVPILRSHEPNLAALRSLDVPCFLPQSGSVFVIGTLPLLKVRCFAAVFQGGRRIARGRLAGHYLESEDPISEIAGEVYARAKYFNHEDIGPEDVSKSESNTSIEDAIDFFAELKDTDPNTYEYWCNVAEVLLEVLPLGLPASLFRVILHEDYRLESIGESKIEQLRKILVENVIYEMGDFLAGDVLGRLTKILGLTPSESVDRFAISEHVDTTDASLQNDLLQERKNSRVWRFIDKVRKEKASVDLPSDDVIVERVLKHSGRTSAGRAIGPAHCAETRRQQVELLADEVMKSVAYSLVSRKLPLAAVEGNQFVLEIPVSETTESELKQIANLAYCAGRKLLGRFAAACVCTPRDRW